MKRTIVLLALLGLAGCNLIDDLVKPAPEPETAYTVTLGDQVCRSGAVPFSVQLDITGKQPGTADREEVTIWAVEEGKDWQGGNPRDGTFTVRCNDSRPDWAKMKVYQTGSFVGEPALKMGWTPDQTYTLRLAVGTGSVAWSATRKGDKASATARIDAATPERVTVCYGDPGSRKAAVGAKITNITWGGN